jgi:apolipoprotein N-acyltransferase
MIPFIFLQCIAGIILFALKPDSAGLYTFLPHGIPLLITIPFLFYSDFRKHFNKYLYFFAGIHFVFLTLDYTLNGHASVVSLGIIFIPVFLFGLFHFIVWNIHRGHEKKSRQALILCTIAWGFYALSFPPLYLGVGAVVFLVPWFIVLFRFPLQSVLFGSFWSGMLYNAINYYWIYNVMKVGPAGFILFGLFLLIAYFSLYNTLAAFVFVKARHFQWKGFPIFLLLFPFFYAGLEMTRSTGDFSFPWSHLGYVFGNHLELLQTLSYIGVFGYTILIIGSNMCVAAGFIFKKKIFLGVPVIILLALFIQGSVILSKPEAKPFYITDPNEAPTLSLVQPSIHQTKKWSHAYYDSVITQTWELITDSVSLQNTDLLILPETAIPDFLKRHPREIRNIRNLIAGTRASVFVGALDYDRKGKPPRDINFYNSGFLFDSSQRRPQRYSKVHLVPFSERIPFDDVIPILNYVNFGEGDFVAGKEIPVYGPFQWTPFICYEAIYGSQIREAIRKGSRMMVNITNDGWFGISTAPGQHLNLIRYRAVENGYPVARDANSGISVFIDQYGHTDQNTKLLTKRVITRKLPLRSRDTLYTHIGDGVEIGLLYFFFLYLLALGLGLALQKKRMHPMP